MKKIGFLGGYDKTDMLLYIARIFATVGKHVLLIDATIIQKARYVVPTISKNQTYITEFGQFDVAVGFNNIEEIQKYLETGSRPLNYDIILMDIDTPEAFRNFEAYENNKNFFVTSFDVYSIKKGLEILNACNQELELVKVIYSNTMSREENQYLDYLSSNCKVKWNRNIVNFPIEYGNYNLTLYNQAAARIKIKGLSEYYKKTLIYLISFIIDDKGFIKEVEKATKMLEREG